MSCVSHINLCPDFGDTENVLLQKILQSLNAGGGSGGAGVSGLSVNGGPFQTGQVSIVTGGGGITSVNGDSGPAVLLDSGDIPEGANLYFSTARVRATDLTGLIIVGGAVSAADTILDALGKFQFRVDALETGASGPFVLRAGDSMTGPLLQAAGSAGAPSFSFTADTDTGIYSSLADRIQFSAGGVLVFSTRSGAVGLAQDTGYFFLGTSESVRLYRDGVGSMGQRSGALEQRFRVYETFTSTSIYSRVALSSESSLFRLYTEAAGGATLRSLQVGTGESSGTDIAGVNTLFHGGQNTGAGIPGALVFQTGSVGASGTGVSALTTRLTVAHDAVTATVPFLGVAGTALLPSFSFSGDPNTGIFSNAADTLLFSTGGDARVLLSTTDLTSTLPILGPVGSDTAPTYSFSSDPDTGIYHGGPADSIYFTTGGVFRFSITTTEVASTLVFLGPNGSAAAPTYSFSNDTNTGIYSVAADALGFSAGGTLRLTVADTLITATVPIQQSDSTALAADPTAASTQQSVSGEWQYRSSAANEGAGQMNRVHNRAAQVDGTGTSYNLTTSYAFVDFGTTDLQITLPTAGTYLIIYEAQALSAAFASDIIQTRLFNSTDSVVVPSPQSAWTVPAALALFHSLNSSAIYTITASKTIQVQAKNNAAARGTIAATDLSAIRYVRLY